MNHDAKHKKPAVATIADQIWKYKIQNLKNYVTLMAWCRSLTVNQL